ncbi:hypothetical protein GCM10027051_10140 [Niabella terrae]
MVTGSIVPEGSPKSNYIIHEPIQTGSALDHNAAYGFNMSLGYQPKSILLHLYNPDSVTSESVIELTNPFLSAVHFYTTDNRGNQDSLLTGARYPFSRRPKNHPNFQFPVKLAPGASVDCRITIEVGTASGDFRLLVWDKEKRNEYQLLETKYLSYFFIINLSFLLFIGIAILMTQQRFHWYYFIYVVFGFLYIYAELGLGFKNIWPEKPRLQASSILLIANIYQVFGLLFVRKYFSTANRQQFCDRLLTGLIVAALLFECIVAGNLLLARHLPKWLVQVNTILFILSGISVFITAGLSMRSKSLKWDAGWFIIGFTPHAISILQLCLRPFGLFNNTNESWFRGIAPVYLDTIHPPNFLFWSVLWEVIIVFWLIIKRLRRLYEVNMNMTRQLAFQRERNMQKLLSGVEQERQRIAQELHDGSGVALSALKMKLQVLKEQKDQYTTDKITALMKEVDRIYEDIRGISHNLMPKTLSKLGLYPAIDELVNQIRIAAPQINFNYYRKTSTNHFSENAKINIYRIIQELLTNVVKHSGAQEVSLQLIKHNDKLMISIEDDGSGFDTRETRNGIGLTGIESRVEMLSGNLSIDATPQNGTFISIFLPLENLN